MKRQKIALPKLLEPAGPARTDMSDSKLDELVESIRELGLLQPIIVKPAADGCFEVVAGHRRLLACRRLNLAHVDCLVKTDELTDASVMVHENVEREELNPIDEAILYLELYEKLEDTRKVAELVKRSSDYVERRMNLVMGRDQEVIEATRTGQISLGVAEEINKMVRHEDRIYHLHFAVRGGATTRQMRDYRVQANARAALPEQPTTSDPDPSGGSPTNTTPEPAAPRFTHQAAPWQLSAELSPRRCIFCGQSHPEHRGFLHFACGDCTDKHLYREGG